MNVLVTGAAGFIGSNLCMRLLEELSDTLVVGLDSSSNRRIQRLLPIKPAAPVTNTFTFMIDGVMCFAQLH